MSSFDNEHLLLVACLLLSLGLLFAWGRLHLWQKDFSLLRESLRALCRSDALPARRRFRSREAEGLWRTMTAIKSGRTEAERAKEVYDEAILLSARLAGASDEQEEAARALIDVLERQLGDALTGAAVLLREKLDESLRVVCCSGVPLRRVENSLCMCFDALLDSEEEEHRWGYHLPEEGTCFDFRVFGVGICLCTPLQGTEGISGGIWLGLSLGHNSLSFRRKEFVQAISEHAAASFHAAKKADERTKKSKRERDFLLGLSHDLRAPGHRALFAVREAIAVEANTGESTSLEQLKLVERAVEEQLSLLADVLDYTKHQKGFLSANAVQCRLRSLLAPLLEDASYSAEKKGLRFLCNGLPDALIEADSQQVKRMVRNLLSNAVKYTDKGSIQVQVERIPGRIRLMIADSGVGVPADERELLFKEYGCGQEGERRGGIGLGLALTKVLAELNSGNVFYCPRPEGGSVFGIELPCCSDEKGRMLSARPMFETVLVVDDDPAACRAAVRCVREFSQRTIPAGSLEEAKKLEKEFAPDLIVSDLQLGDGDASDFLIEAGSRASVLLLSGDSEAWMAPGLDELPSFSRLEKPATRESFDAALRNLYDNAR